jgi:hypothetical protein
VEASMRRRGKGGEACAAASGDGSESAAASGDAGVEATRRHRVTHRLTDANAITQRSSPMFGRSCASESGGNRKFSTLNVAFRNFAILIS